MDYEELSGVHWPRCFETYAERELTRGYGHETYVGSLIEHSPYTAVEFGNTFSESIFTTPNDAGVGRFFLKVVEICPCCQDFKKVDVSLFTKYMKKSRYLDAVIKLLLDWRKSFSLSSKKFINPRMSGMEVRKLELVPGFKRKPGMKI